MEALSSLSIVVNFLDGIRKNDSDVVTASAQLGSQTLIGDNTGRLYETNGNSAQVFMDEKSPF